jgi:hypothetical protein
MKRLFPRAVPETLVALMFLGGACGSPSSNPPAGAPVLTTLSIVDASNHNNHFVDVTAATPNCAMGSAEGQDCDPGTAVCELDGNVVCQCVAKDMCDPSIKPDAAVTGGTLNCTFPALSAVLATFDRLLDTAPFTAMTPVAMLSATPPATPTPTPDTEYNSAGAATGLIFTAAFNDPTGPSIVTSGVPAIPTASTVTVTLDKGTITAKDKTPFTGMNLLADGKIAWKTTSFSASITVPAPPPPMSMDMGMMMMGCPDAGAMMPEMDGGSADGGDGGSADGGVVDAAPTVDATVDAGEPSSDGGTDAAMMTPAPSTDVPLGMNMDPVTIAFTNTVKNDVMMHITMTEDGQPFMGFTTSGDTMFPTNTVKLVPMTMWAAGKTYEVDVDMSAADVFGATIGKPGASATFTMSAK